MTRRISLLTLTLLTLACSPSPDPIAGGSETGSLGLVCASSGSCGALACVCGVCSAPCDACPKGTMCQDLGVQDPPISRAQCLDTTAVCLPLCDARTACPGSTRCDAGVCVPTTLAPRVARVPADLGIRPLNVIGDGVADDTDALQVALDAARPGDAVVLSPGTYRVTRPLVMRDVWLQGSRDVVIRADDGVIPAERAVLEVRGTSVVRALLVDVGENPGALGVEVRGKDRAALLDLGVRGQGRAAVGVSGDLDAAVMMARVVLEGSLYGVEVTSETALVTLKEVHVRGQSEAGVLVNQGVVAIDGLSSSNEVPALRVTGARADVTGHRLRLDASESMSPAIDHIAGALLLQDLTALGYASALMSRAEVVLDAGSHPQWMSSKVWRVSGGGSPMLDEPAPLSGAPDAWAHLDPGEPSQWARILPNGDPEIQRADAQRLLDEGGSTVYVSGGRTQWEAQELRVGPQITHILGFGHEIGTSGEIVLTLRVEGDAPTPLVVEGFLGRLKIEHLGRRRVLLRHGTYLYRSEPGAGSLMVEDARILDDVLLRDGAQIWSASLTGDGIVTGDGDVWWVGMRSDRRGSILRQNTGNLVLLGGLLRPSATPEADTVALDWAIGTTGFGSWRMAGGLHDVPVSLHQEALRSDQLQEEPTIRTQLP